jgi:hypothetical protein
MAVKRPNKDNSTLIAESFSAVLTGIQGRIKNENPVGFGQEEVSPNEYKKRLLGMSKAERISEIDKYGLDAVADALSNKEI